MGIGARRHSKSDPLSTWRDSEHEIAITPIELLPRRMDDMNADLSWRESLNVAAEPGRDLLETDILDGRKSVCAKKRCNAGRLETAGPALRSFLKLFGPLRYNSSCLF